MSSPPVETRQLTKRYEHLTAVDALDLEVRAGEVYGFLGPNGAGKTTTLRMLLGLIRPTSGEVRLFGRAPGERGHLSRVGSLVEGPAFYPYLSGRDNLRVMARHARVGRERIPKALELVALSERAGDLYRSYSLGMKQRLGWPARCWPTRAWWSWTSPPTAWTRPAWPTCACSCGASAPAR